MFSMTVYIKYVHIRICFCRGIIVLTFSHWTLRAIEI